MGSLAAMQKELDDAEEDEVEMPAKVLPDPVVEETHPEPIAADEAAVVEEQS